VKRHKIIPGFLGPQTFLNKTKKLCWDKIIYFLLAVVLGFALYFLIGKFAYLFFLSFFVVFLFMPHYINWAHNRKIVNTDCHKYKKPLFANMGGYIVLLGFFLGCFASFPFVSGFDLYSLIAGCFTILLVGFVGSFDDLFRLNEIQKIILLLVAAVPLMATFTGTSIIYVPFVGDFDLSYVYYFVIIPVMILVYSNSTNMLAGYNGLEAGLGIITLLFLTFAAILIQELQVLFILIPLLGALIGFYFYNAYPAKVILGDIGTLSIGASLAVTMILGNFEILGLLLTLVYIINFCMYALFFFFIRGKEAHISSCDKNGHLVPTYYEKNGKKHIAWHKSYFLMEHLCKGKLTEKGLVRNFFILHFVISLVVFLIYFL
jgi:UDP-N-acetylglucosamine--dolichyl-phosphate N-acetylglucosaminephosphotransferase